MRHVYFAVFIIAVLTFVWLPSQVDGLFILATLALFGSVYLVQRLDR